MHTIIRKYTDTCIYACSCVYTCICVIFCYVHLPDNCDHGNCPLYNSSSLSVHVLVVKVAVSETLGKKLIIVLYC